ncbi:hypothetical protein HK097_000680, partial [Rhizophlyctis rosea]
LCISGEGASGFAEIEGPTEWECSFEECRKRYGSWLGMKYHLEKVHKMGKARKEDASVVAVDGAGDASGGRDVTMTDVEDGATTEVEGPTEWECKFEDCKKRYGSWMGMKYHLEKVHDMVKPRKEDAVVVSVDEERSMERKRGKGKGNKSAKGKEVDRGEETDVTDQTAYGDVTMGDGTTGEDDPFAYRDDDEDKPLTPRKRPTSSSTTSQPSTKKVKFTSSTPYSPSPSPPTPTSPKKSSRVAAMKTPPTPPSFTSPFSSPAPPKRKGRPPKSKPDESVEQSDKSVESKTERKAGPGRGRGRKKKDGKSWVADPDDPTLGPGKDDPLLVPEVANFPTMPMEVEE